MVDSIGSLSSTQNVQGVKSTAAKKDDAQKVDGSSSAPVDDVQISDEALLAQISQTARDASEALAQDNSSVLSNDAKRLDALV